MANAYTRYTMTTTMDNEVEEKGWSINDLYDSEFTLEELKDTLETVAKFREKYPNDDVIEEFEKTVRDEMCQMLGGSILYE